jgi:hypothetical protein
MGLFWLILFILILIWIASPIIRVWRKVRQFQDEYTRTMNQTQHQSPGGAGEDPQEKSMADRYRKYSETTAENVDFEELEGKMEETVDSNVGQERTTRYQEEVISDAEYEEIP